MIYLASLSINDQDALKILMGLGATIIHLYWQSFRCRDRHESTKERLSKLENKLASCPADDCPLQKSGPTFSPSYCIHQPAK